MLLLLRFVVVVLFVEKMTSIPYLFMTDFRRITR